MMKMEMKMMMVGGDDNNNKRRWEIYSSNNRKQDSKIREILKQDTKKQAHEVCYWGSRQ